MLDQTSAKRLFCNINTNIVKLNHHLFEYICSLCGCVIEEIQMSTIPYGTYMAQKVRQNDRKISKIDKVEKESETLFLRYPLQLTPMKYSSKLMNSIWGMYNRYSVHNLKKIMDDEQIFNVGNQQMSSVVSNVEKSNSMENKNKTSQSFIKNAIWSSPENYY